jgi:hypothetical protein
MKHLMIYAFAAIALLAAATTMLLSHTPAISHATGSADLMSSQAAAPDVNKLPTEEFEDQSLVYSRTKQ